MGNKKSYKRHGMKNHPCYTIWSNMKQRCYYENGISYKNYGGRGITVCDEWKNDFMAFYNYVSKLPDYDEDGLGRNGLTMDRIDNNGDYKPGNIRWVNMHFQVLNRRLDNRGVTKYLGVYPNHKNFAVRIGKDGKEIYVGTYPTEEEAALARDEYIIANNMEGYRLQILTNLELLNQKK